MRLRVIGVDASIGLDRALGWKVEISYGARMISEFIETNLVDGTGNTIPQPWSAPRQVFLRESSTYHGG